MRDQQEVMEFLMLLWVLGLLPLLIVGVFIFVKQFRVQGILKKILFISISLILGFTIFSMGAGFSNIIEGGGPPVISRGGYAFTGILDRFEPFKIKLLVHYISMFFNIIIVNKLARRFE